MPHISRRAWLAALGAGLAAPRSSSAAPQAAPSAPAPKPAAPARSGGLPLEQYEPKSMLVVPETQVPRAKFPVIDVHTHPTGRARRTAGVPVGVNLSPMIPGLNDHEIEAIMAAAAEAGAASASWILIRLPHEVKELFEAWLGEHYPERSARVLSLIRQSREGRLNDPNFGSRMRGSGPFAKLIRERFLKARARCGLDRRLPPLRADLFRPPDDTTQLSLF